MEDKYYIELFTLENVILYGYAVNTDIPKLGWSTKRYKVKNKINIIKYTCILEKEEFKQFIRNLERNIIEIETNKIKAGLKSEKTILNINEKNKQHNIINKLAYKTVLCNLDKNDLLSKINSVFGNEDVNENIEKIDLKLKDELGFSWKQNIKKLGSFEIYNLIQDKTFFSYIDNDNNIIVEKITKFEEDLIINITSWNDDEININKIYRLNKDEDKKIIKLDSNIEQIRVIIWKLNSGDIVYFDNACFMERVFMTTNLVTRQNKTHDQWSTKIKTNPKLTVDALDDSKELTETKFNNNKSFEDKTENKFDNNKNFEDKTENEFNNNKSFEDEEEIINLYRSIKESSGNKLEILEGDFNEEKLAGFKEILNNNKTEICEYFLKECCNENLKAFKAVSLLMYMCSEVHEEIINNFEIYNLSIEKVHNYIQIILGNDNISEKSAAYLSLKKTLERLCNNNPITAEEFQSIKGIFNNPASWSKVNNKFVLCFLQLLRRYNPEKLLKLIIDVKAPIVYSEFLNYLSLEWNEEIFKQLLECKATTFKELGFAYAYRSMKNKSSKEEKIKFIDGLLLIMNSCDKSELMAFILTSICDECNIEETDEFIKEYVMEELIKSLDENSSIKRILFLLNCSDNKKTIYNLYEICSRIEFNDFKTAICRKIGELVKIQCSDEDIALCNINEINRILWIGAGSRLLLKNNNLIIKDVKEELVINNYRVLGNPCLREINYSKWKKILDKFIINFIYKSYLIDQYEGKDKAYLLNSIIDELCTAMTGICQIKSEDSLFGVMIIISIISKWIRSGYIDEKKIYNVSPDWIKIIFILNEQEFNKDLLEKLLEENFKFDVYSQHYGGTIIASFIGEYIASKEIIEQDIQIKNEINEFREKFVSKYIDSNEYSEYLNLLVSGEAIDDIDWQERSAGFSGIQLMLY